MSSSRSHRTKQRWLWTISTILVVGGGFFAMAMLFSASQGVLIEGGQREAVLNTQYAHGIDILTACVKETKQSADLTVKDPAKLDKVLADAVTGNYDSGNNLVDTDKFLLAIHDAYPNLSVVDTTFQPVLATINECRHDYAKQQAIVRASVDDFKSWKVSTLGTVRLPDDKLYIKTPGQTARGQAALKMMSEMGGKE